MRPSENKDLLALTHDEKKKESNVQEAEYKEPATKEEQQKENDNDVEESNNTKDSKPWWRRMFQ